MAQGSLFQILRGYGAVSGPSRSHPADWVERPSKGWREALLERLSDCVAETLAWILIVRSLRDPGGRPRIYQDLKVHDVRVVTDIAVNEYFRG